MGRVCVVALIAAAGLAGCGGTGMLRAASVGDSLPHKVRVISTSTPTLLPVSAGSAELNCPFHDRLGGQTGPSFQLR